MGWKKEKALLPIEKKQGSRMTALSKEGERPIIYFPDPDSRLRKKFLSSVVRLFPSLTKTTMGWEV